MNFKLFVSREIIIKFQQSWNFIVIGNMKYGKFKREGLKDQMKIEEIDAEELEEIYIKFILDKRKKDIKC